VIAAPEVDVLQQPVGLPSYGSWHARASILRKDGIGSRLDAISDAVHEAMVALLDVPQRDRFQIISERSLQFCHFDPTISTSTETSSSSSSGSPSRRVGRPAPSRRSTADSRRCKASASGCDNFAYVGHRATGTDAGSFVLVAPDWDGEPPADATLIRFPPRVPDELRFFEQMRVWLQAFPPAPRDRDYQQRFEPLGLFAADSPYTDGDSGLAAELRAGIAAGRERMEQALRQGTGPTQNGWNLTYHAFDYNLDFFEVGAPDDDTWKLPDGPGRYLMRALAARGGLWGNHGYEAAYAMVYLDADGHELDGAGGYELRFATPPPCRAFWSVPMYDTPDFSLVANPVDRYSIGDRTRGLHAHDDGSLTIVMQPDEPSESERRQLAANSERCIQTDPAHVRARRRCVRRRLPAPADHANALTGTAARADSCRPLGVRAFCSDLPNAVEEGIHEIRGRRSTTDIRCHSCTVIARWR